MISRRWGRCGGFLKLSPKNLRKAEREVTFSPRSKKYLLTPVSRSIRTCSSVMDLSPSRERMRWKPTVL